MKLYRITTDTTISAIIADDKDEAINIFKKDNDGVIIFENGKYKMDFDGYIEDVIINEVPIKKGSILQYGY